MPAERAPMRKIREALRLKHALGLSERLVAMSVGVSRSTVAEYLRRAGVVGITWPVPETMDDAELERRLFTPASFEVKPARGLPDWNHIHKELKRRGVTLQLLWRSTVPSTPTVTDIAASAISIGIGGRPSRQPCGRRMPPARSCSSTGRATRCRCSTRRRVRSVAPTSSSRCWGLPITPTPKAAGARRCRSGSVPTSTLSRRSGACPVPWCATTSRPA